MHTETVELLLENGKILIENAWVAMVIAIENECTDVVRLIFEYIGDINIQSKKDGTSILMIASEKGYTQTVELLLKRDAEVNMCNNDNLSSLMIASSNGRTEIVSLLLTYKAKVNMQGKDGCSALTLASRNDHFEVAKRLLEYGCDVNLREDSGATALMIACSNGYYKIVELLLQHDADVNLQDNIGMSALTFASEIGHNRMVKLLLFHQAKVNQRQDIGWFPLMYASNKGHVETVEILLEYGANVNMQSYCGWSALTVATNERHTETKEVLKAHGAITILSAGYDSKDTFTEIISVNNLEQIFSWHEFGLNIHIPDNSLPEDLQQCTIKIEASIGGDFELPPNTHLVSAVYSIKCDPKCQFSRQLVTLEIQHCAKPENTHKLFFVKALTSTEKTAVFREIKSEKSTQSGSNSTFPNHCSYGFVELNKFCKVAIAQRDTDERNYCAAIYYHKVDAKHYRIHFSIFWNDQLHSKVRSAILSIYENDVMHTMYVSLQVVHEQMCSWQKSIIKGHDQKVEFMENQIELDIPSQGGVTSQNGEWRILPLSPPVVRV